MHILGCPEFRASELIQSAAVSRDGARLAVVTYETLEVFDASSGARLACARHDLRELCHACAWSPDGQMIACGGSSGVALFAAADLAHVKTWGDPKVRALEFSPDGALLACARTSVQLWDARGDQLVRELASRCDLTNIAFSPDGTQLVAAGDSKLRVFDVATGKVTATLEQEHELARFVPGGRMLVTASWDGEIALWDVATWKPRARWQPLGKLYGIHVDAETVFASGDSQSSGEGVRIQAFDLGGQIRRDDAYDEGYVATICGAGAKLFITSIQSTLVAPHPGEPVRDHAAEVRRLAISHDGTWLASAGRDRATVVWRLATGTPHARIVVADEGGYLSRHQPRGLAFDRSGTKLAIGVGDQLAIADVATGAVESSFRAHATGDTNAVAFSDDGKQVASANNRVLGNVPTLAVHTLAGSPAAQVRMDYFASELRWIDQTHVQALTPQHVAVADVASATMGRSTRHRLDYVVGNEHAASADGQWIADGARGEVFVWRTATGETATRIEHADVSSVALSVDGSLLAIGSWPHHLSILALPEGRLLFEQPDLPSAPSCLAFAPAGDAVAAGHHDGSITIHALRSPS